jgi:hypothetical protein
MEKTNFRIIEELDNGEQVITYFEVGSVNNQFYYWYNDERHGPFEDVEETVNAAYKNLIPVSE